MALSFTLHPESLIRFHGVLTCLARFNESVSIEATAEGLRLSALNSTKSAHVSFRINAHPFFTTYACKAAPPTTTTRGSQALSDGGKHGVTFQLYTKKVDAWMPQALLSVFKGRANDPRNRDVGIERCVVTLYDEDAASRLKCRLIIRMFCKHGTHPRPFPCPNTQWYRPQGRHTDPVDSCLAEIVKTYKLTYEAVDVQHAIFDSRRVVNKWRIESQVLREVMDHFGGPSYTSGGGGGGGSGGGSGPGASEQQLDIYCKDGRAIFTSFAVKISDGTEILRQPVHTSVAIDTHDFDFLSLDADTHAAISIKDFRAIVAHAAACRVAVSCEFSRPCRPMRFSYDLDDGAVLCEFTLMTRDASGDAAAAAAAAATTTAATAATGDCNGDVEASGRVEVGSADVSASPQERFEWRRQESLAVLAKQHGAVDGRARDSATSPAVPQLPSTSRPLPTPPPAAMPPPLPAGQPTQAATLAQPTQAAQPTQSLLEDESLFVPVDADDDDQQWNEPNYDEDDGEGDILRWDTGRSRFEQSTLHRFNGGAAAADGETEPAQIPPTQHVSQIRGLFD
ncbi:hypothetical protein KEM52_004760 [Ascosphaera acerosa]|nr:hypothetical protein KEM52_004760 [Ascosphaera acerosa]